MIYQHSSISVFFQKVRGNAPQVYPRITKFCINKGYAIENNTKFGGIRKLSFRINEFGTKLEDTTPSSSLGMYINCKHSAASLRSTCNSAKNRFSRKKAFLVQISLNELPSWPKLLLLVQRFLNDCTMRQLSLNLKLTQFCRDCYRFANQFEKVLIPLKPTKGHIQLGRPNLKTY